MVTMRYTVKVSRKGQIVIPAEIRRKYGIKDKVVVVVGDDGIRIVPLVPLKELYGIDGDIMRKVAEEISRERREEAKHED